MPRLQNFRPQPADPLRGQTRVQGAGDHLLRAQMAVHEHHVGALLMAELAVGLRAGCPPRCQYNTIPRTSGSWARPAPRRCSPGPSPPGRPDWPGAASSRHVQRRPVDGGVIAVIAGRHGGFQLELRRGIVEGGAEVHAGAQPGIQRAGGGIERARLLRAPAPANQTNSRCRCWWWRRRKERCFRCCHPNTSARPRQTGADCSRTWPSAPTSLPRLNAGNKMDAKDANDRDGDQEFDQGEAGRGPWRPACSFTLAPPARSAAAARPRHSGQGSRIPPRRRPAGETPAPAGAGSAAGEPRPATRADFLFRFRHNPISPPAGR